MKETDIIKYQNTKCCCVKKDGTRNIGVYTISGDCIIFDVGSDIIFPNGQSLKNRQLKVEIPIAAIIDLFCVS